MIKIRVLFPGSLDEAKPVRLLEDLIPWQDDGVQISFSTNSMGPFSCASELDNALAAGTLAFAARRAEKEGVDAIVIETAGDTGLAACREAVSIPVIGLSDVSIRIAQMLGRKFGLITAARWHGYALERVMHTNMTWNCQYVGFRHSGLKPFLTDKPSEAQFLASIVNLIKQLVLQDADTIVFGGSYFLGIKEAIQTLLDHEGCGNITLIEQLPLAIRFARMMVDSRLCQNKKIYATPKEYTPAKGYPADLFC